MNKKHLITLLGLLAMEFGGVSGAWGTGAPAALVRLHIQPSISIGAFGQSGVAMAVGHAATSAVKRVTGSDLRQTPSGLIRADVQFSMSMNSEAVALACGATDLRNEVDAADVIALHQGSGCGISLENGRSAHSGATEYVAADEVGNEYFAKTGFVHFRPNVGGRTNSATLQVAWQPVDTHQATNAYSARVKLYAFTPQL